MMSKSREVRAVLLRKERLDMFAFFGIVELKRVIGASSKQKLARVVKIDGGYESFGLGEFEKLNERIRTIF